MKLNKVEVEWIDSCKSNGWGSLKYHVGELTFSRCWSVGYVIQEDKKSISLAQSLSEDTKNIADVISIPKVAIKTIKKLK